MSKKIFVVTWTNHVVGQVGPEDIKCLLEARLKGQQPTVVTDTAATLEQAAKGAAGKMKSSLESTLGRLSDRR